MSITDINSNKIFDSCSLFLIATLNETFVKYIGKASACCKTFMRSTWNGSPQQAGCIIIVDRRNRESLRVYLVRNTLRRVIRPRAVSTSASDI